MRILLDESLPRRLGNDLVGHEVQTVQKRGWSGMKNGDLLRQASQEFDVMITGDQNIQYQQNQNELPIAIVVLVAVDNRLETMRVLVPQLLESLAVLEPGTLIRVGE